MSRLYAIGLAALAWLVVIIALASLTTTNTVAHRQAGQSIALTDLEIGGVPGPKGLRAPETANRNPFSYAPTFEQEAFTELSDPTPSRGLLTDLDMTLEGVQGRSGKFTAFINFRGERRPLRKGDRVGDHFVVAQIEKDRIHVLGAGNESRWIYLTQ